MGSEEQRLKDVFENYYYKGLSSTNSKNAIDNSTILDLFNDFMVVSQIIYVLVNNGKEDLPNMKILDAGCGNGRMLRKMCELGAEPENCYGMDLSGDVIDYARENTTSKMCYNWDVGDIKDTRFLDNTFDVIFNLGVLIHIKDNDYIKDIAKEFYRVLKPGGLAFVIVSNETTQWSDTMLEITRNFTEAELLGLFDIFQCIGISPAYSSYYFKEQGSVRISKVMEAFETEIKTEFNLFVFKK